MAKNTTSYHMSKHIEKIFGITRKVLLYWRKIGLVNPSMRTDGGHYRYSFEDLVAIKTITNLNKAGISTFKIKKTIESLKKQFPDLESPLSQKSFCVIGKEIYVVDKKTDFNPLTGQYSFILNKETKSLVKVLARTKFDEPESVKRRVAVKR